MIIDFVLVILVMLFLQKVVKSGKAILYTGLLYAIVMIALKLYGGRGNDLVTLVKSMKSYHDSEIRKLYK